MVQLGSIVCVTSMARADAIGKVIELHPAGVLVRLPNWQADGYKLDVQCRVEELTVANQAERRSYYQNAD